MRNPLKQTSPAVLVILTAAILASIEMIASTAPRHLAASASEVDSHAYKCFFCQLPLQGQVGQSSKFGPSPHAAESRRALSLMTLETDETR